MEQQVESLANNGAGIIQIKKPSKLKKLGKFLMIAPPVGSALSLFFLIIIQAVATASGASSESVAGMIIALLKWLLYLIGFISTVGIMVGIPLGIVFFFVGKAKEKES